MPGGNGEKSPSIVVKPNRVIESRRLRGQLAKARHAFGAVVKPPRRTQTEARIVPCQGRQLAAVGGFIQREQDNGERRVVAKAFQQRQQSADIVGRGWDVGPDVPSEPLKN